MEKHEHVLEHLLFINKILYSIGDMLFYSILILKFVNCQILPDRCMQAGYIALTFDDGPVAYTSHVLEVLAENEVPATFHFTTQHINQHNISSKIDQALDENHCIGLQLDPSRDYDEMSKKEVDEEISTQLDVLSDATGSEIQYVRAPVENGETNQAVYDSLKTKGIIQSHYNICPYHEAEDVESAEEKINKLFKQSNPKYDSFIFQLQEEREKDFPIMEHIIKKGKEEGYEFVTLEKCLDGYTAGTHVHSKRKSRSAANDSHCSKQMLPSLISLMLL